MMSIKIEFATYGLKVLIKETTQDNEELKHRLILSFSFNCSLHATANNFRARGDSLTTTEILPSTTRQKSNASKISPEKRNNPNGPKKLKLP